MKTDRYALAMVFGLCLYLGVKVANEPTIPAPEATGPSFIEKARQSIDHALSAPFFDQFKPRR